MPTPAISRVIILFILTICLAVPALADPPTTISYQARANDAAGQPLEGDYAVTFALYTTGQGGDPLWSESYPSLTFADGVASVRLGSITPLDLDFDQPYYLGMAVGSEAEMTPRRPLNAAPHAHRAMKMQWEGLENVPQGMGPYENVVVVAKTGGQFTGIQAAVDSLTAPSAANRYLVWVAPGVYEESVDLPDYVSLRGADRDLTIIAPPAGASGGVAAGAYSEISDLTVRWDQESSFFAISMESASPRIRRVKIETSTSEALMCFGLFVYQSPGARIEDVEVDMDSSGSSTSWGIMVIGSAGVAIADTVVAIDGGASSTGISLDSSDCEIKGVDVTVAGTSLSRAVFVGGGTESKPTSLVMRDSSLASQGTTSGSRAFYTSGENYSTTTARLYNCRLAAPRGGEHLSLVVGSHCDFKAFASRIEMYALISETNTHVRCAYCVDESLYPRTVDCHYSH